MNAFHNLKNTGTATKQWFIGLALAAGLLLGSGSTARAATTTGPALPPVTAGMVVWLSGDGVNPNDTVQVRTSGPDIFVKKWIDPSGSGQDASQANDNDQPRYLANDLNGLPTVKWDGAGKFLRGPANVTMKTIFVVCKKDGEATGLDGMFCQSPDADSNNIRGDGNIWRAPGNEVNGGDFPDNGKSL